MADPRDNSRHRLDRRRLLGGLGALPLAAAATRAFAQEAEGQPMRGDPDLPAPPGERMRWAIVGLGGFAVGQVIPHFRDAHHSRMTAFVSGNPDKARRLGAAYGVDRFYTYDTYDQIANDPEIDRVYIALPVGLHAEYTIRALQAGKHVLCEKPMASTVAECEAMIAAARAANRQLGVAYRVHFEPANMEALRRIRAGELGPLRYIQCDHGFDTDPDHPPTAWRLDKELAGGGSMYDVGVYGLNTSLMMLDGNPVEVSAVYAYPRDDPRFAEVEGGLAWRLLMDSGIGVQGSSSYCWQPYISRQRYFGAEGSIEMDPATGYYENELLFRPGDGPAHTVGTGRSARQFAAQVDGFSQAAREGRPHRTPGEMGLRDIRLITAMYESADNGGQVIRV